VCSVRGHFAPLPRSTPVGARARGGRAVAQFAQPRRRRVGVVGHGLGRDGAAVLVALERRRGTACNERRVLQCHKSALCNVARGRGICVVSLDSINYMLLIDLVFWCFGVLLLQADLLRCAQMYQTKHPQKDLPTKHPQKDLPEEDDDVVVDDDDEEDWMLGGRGSDDEDEDNEQ
jgi:hypothetical protein